MPLESILSRLRGVRREGKGWKALCPAHADKNPSLSISEENNRVLLHCFAGCPTESVSAALGIQVQDLFAGGHGERRIVAIYDYCDEKGELLSQVVRFDPKDFRQRRPNGNGGWTWKMGGTRRVLYRLSEVLEAKSVLVCEGEKDCETARTLGLVATTNAAGGKSKWLQEYSECLRGKRIVIIADADEPGRKHAQQVAASLFENVESLKVLELPRAKDLTEWVRQGGVREALLELIRNTDEWKAQAGPSVEIIRAWDEIPDAMMMSAPKTEWIAEGIIPRASVTLIAGEPGSYKTWLALSLLRGVSTGGRFLERECKPTSVLYLDRENPLTVIRERMAMLGMEALASSKIWGGWLPDAPPAIGDVRLLQIARDRHPS